MAAISIIILLALLFYLFYFSERMKRIREIVARPIISLTIIAIISVLFLVADYNGRYYGLSPMIFNPVRLPQDASFKIDRYYNFYITREDELEILGPGFRLFCKTEEINNANWRTHLIENYEIFTFIRIMSILVLLIGVSSYVLGLRRR